MKGWRSRLGFLIPPGSPTTEPEIAELTAGMEGVSVHYTRMFASGITGSLSGQDERNREQIEHMDETVSLLAMVKPKVIGMAHTATSYTLGKDGEAALKARMESTYGIPFITAFGSVLAALAHLGTRRIAFVTPYGADTTLRGKAHLEAYGVEVVSHGNLPGVTNIYDESAERAYGGARALDCPEAEAVFISGVGMPTVAVLELLERDLGKPVISSTAALTWNAFREAGIHGAVPGYGRLLASF